MPARYYETPHVPEDVKIANLVRQGLAQQELTPDREVVAINRGVKPIKDMFDGQHFVIPPGLFRGRYDMVKHFQDRAVVPGTRNVEGGTEESFIGIIGLDEAARCEPLSVEQLERAGLAIEAIDRQTLHGHAQDVRVIRSSAATLRTVGRGVRGVVSDAREQPPGVTPDSVQSALAKAVERDKDGSEVRNFESTVRRDEREAPKVPRVRRRT